MTNDKEVTPRVLADKKEDGQGDRPGGDEEPALTFELPTEGEAKPEVEAKPEPAEATVTAETASDEEPKKEEPEPPAMPKEPPPVITKLRPAAGPLAGGTPVVIEGTAFVEGCVTKVDRVVMKSTFVSPTELTFTSLPRNVLGRVDVEVTNPDEQRALMVLGYEYCPPPVLAGIVPDHGPQTGGIQAVLTGDHLRPGVEVRIGASRPHVEYRGPTRLDLVISAHPFGVYDVEVVNPEGQAGHLKDGFRFDAAPRLHRVTPDHGPFGTTTPIVIEGEHFRFGCAVYLGGELVPSELKSSSRIEAVAPPHDGAGAALLRVINIDGLDGEMAEGFRYDPLPAPRVAGIEPSHLPRGREDKAVVSGEWFAEGCTVRIDGAVMRARYVSDTRIEVTVPAIESVGRVALEVENPDGRSHLLEGALELSGPPELTGVQPREASAAGGEVLTLNGLWFQKGCQATVGGVGAKTTWESETTLHVVAPRGAPGVADVVVTNVDGQRATLTGGLAYVAPQAPVIVNLEPTTGPACGGTRVVVRGEHLDTVARALVGGTPATGLQTVGADLVFVTPPTPRDGAANVELITRAGASALRMNAFQYTPVSPPVISSLSPNRVAVGGGTEVTISGENFLPGVIVLVDREPVASAKVRDKGTIVFKTPAGEAGAMADVAVRSPTGQQAVSKRAFLFDPRYR